MKKLTLLLLPLSLVSCMLPPPPLAPRPPFSSERSAPPRPRPRPPTSDNNPQNLIGLSVAEAAHRAGLMGLSYRVVKRDGISYPVTMDYSESRLNFSISHGRVIAVTRG